MDIGAQPMYIKGQPQVTLPQVKYTYTEWLKIRLDILYWWGALFSRYFCPDLCWRGNRCFTAWSGLSCAAPPSSRTVRCGRGKVDRRTRPRARALPRSSARRTEPATTSSIPTGDPPSCPSSASCRPTTGKASFNKEYYAIIMRPVVESNIFIEGL